MENDPALTVGIHYLINKITSLIFIKYVFYTIRLDDEIALLQPLRSQISTDQGCPEVMNLVAAIHGEDNHV